MKRSFGIDTRLVKGRGGVFEVTLGTDQGDELLFSKKKLGRFPAPGEIEGELQARLSSADGS